MPALEGRDLIARAKTGTGKTLAFGIPIIKLLTEDDEQRSSLRYDYITHANPFNLSVCLLTGIIYLLVGGLDAFLECWSLHLPASWQSK